jgi:hypothetical protein
LPLERVLELLAAPVAEPADLRVLRFLGVVARVDAARAVEYVLQGKTLHARRIFRVQGGDAFQHDHSEDQPAAPGSDPALAVLVSLAGNGGHDGRVFALHRRAADRPAVLHEPAIVANAASERLSLLYAFSPDTAWAL